jgi:hypothetical protein
MTIEKYMKIQKQVKPLSSKGLEAIKHLEESGHTVDLIVTALKEDPTNFIFSTVEEDLLKESRIHTKIQALSLLILVAIWIAVV